MKKFFLLCGILLLSYALKAQKQFVVDPNAEMRTLNGSFNSIMVSGGIDLYISQSGKEEVAVSSSEERYIAGIKTVIENNTLKIYYDGEKGWNKRDRYFRAYVSVNNLQKLEASGASDIHVSGTLKQPSLTLKMSGASDFKGDINSGSLTIDLSGASDATISGTATTVNLECSGASDVNAYALITERCTVKANGASDVYITVNSELNAHASGASNIIYKGNATLKEVQSSGASNVTRKK